MFRRRTFSLNGIHYRVSINKNMCPIAIPSHVMLQDPREWVAFVLPGLPRPTTAPPVLFGFSGIVFGTKLQSCLETYYIK